MIVVKKCITKSDIEYLAMLHKTLNSFLTTFSKLKIQDEVLDEIGDIESFYFSVNGTYVYEVKDESCTE